MNRLARLSAILIVGAALGYAGFCLFWYATEEQRMFLPEALPADYAFSFPQPFQEHRIPAGRGTSLDALLFTADPSRGVVFFLGGDGGNMRGGTTASAAAFFTAANFDFFQVDYPGYGKSDGKITSEDQLNEAIQAAYDWINQRYPESRIIVVGYSFGTAPASRVACRHHPQRLVLLAPFYSNIEFERRDHPFYPTRLLRYQMRTDLELARCQVPVSMFHGENDGVIPPSDSTRLKALMKPTDTLLMIPGTGHGDLPESPEFRRAMQALLAAGIHPLADAPKHGTIRVK